LISSKHKRFGRKHAHRGEFVAGVANEHAGLPYSSVPNGHTLDESWGSSSHWNKHKEQQQEKTVRIA